MTIAEVTLLIEIYNERKEQEQKEKAQEIYSLAALIGIAYATNNPLSSGKNKFPSIEQVFPSLFKQEKPKQQDWRIAKERLMNYAIAHNQKREVENNK